MTTVRHQGAGYLSAETGLVKSSLDLQQGHPGSPQQGGAACSHPVRCDTESEHGQHASELRAQAGRNGDL